MAVYTNAERFFRALERKEPDVVPHFEFNFSPVVRNKILPGASYEDFIEHMDWDALTHYEFHKEKVISENPRVTRDEWGTLKRYTTEVLPIPLAAAVKSEKDLERYEIPNPDDEDRFEQIQRWAKQYKGERAIVVLVYDLNWLAANIMGFDDRLIAFYTNPELVLLVNQIVLEYRLRYIKNAIEAGADVILIAGDWAYKNGPMFSQEHYNKFVLPPFKRTVQEIKKHGVYVMKHSDGNCWSFIDSLIETGVDAFHPIDPLADMDIGEVKCKYGDRLCLMGNVNCASTLTFGTTDEVREETEEVIRKAGTGGGLICMSSNSIHSAVKPENYIEMLKTIREYGKYPLSS